MRRAEGARESPAGGGGPDAPVEVTWLALGAVAVKAL
jgi:hypothetical protein